MSGDALSAQWNADTELPEGLEVYRSQDGQVSKYIHADGSETAIKTVSSCGNILNKATGKVEPVKVERNKFSVFISTSVGCPVGCKFCYLTTKKYPYRKLKPKQIIDNVKEALSAEIQVKPELRKKYMKLSWMGMGDAFLLDPKDLVSISYELVTWTIGDMGYAFGLDGVDIATTYPSENYGWPHQIGQLNDKLNNRVKINPTSRGRSTVRLFYSLHSVKNRNEIIPLCRFNNPVSDLVEFQKVRQWYGIDVILHYMFLEGINDSEGDIDNIKILIGNIIPNAELRILRFNECDGSKYKESSKFDELVKLCSDKLPKVKYQISAGSEIKAACGQFLCLTNKQK